MVSYQLTLGKRENKQPPLVEISQIETVYNLAFQTYNKRTFLMIW